LVSDVKNAGRTWRPAGQPEPVRVHDFLIPTQGKAARSGLYDLTRNAGWVSVGIDHDTATFAGRTIGRWWQKMGRPRYPRARSLLITADAGGSNGARTPPVEVGVATARQSHGADDHDQPLSPGHEQVEHHRASPVLAHQPQLAGASAGESGRLRQPDRRHAHATGLRVRSELDRGSYPKGRTISDAQLAALRLIAPEPPSDLLRVRPRHLDRSTTTDVDALGVRASVEVSLS
jgi:hypothetical protein